MQRRFRCGLPPPSASTPNSFAPPGITQDGCFPVGMFEDLRATKDLRASRPSGTKDLRASRNSQGLHAETHAERSSHGARTNVSSNLASNSPEQLVAAPRSASGALLERPSQGLDGSPPPPPPMSCVRHRGGGAGPCPTPVRLASRLPWKLTLAVFRAAVSRQRWTFGLPVD